MALISFEIYSDGTLSSNQDFSLIIYGARKNTVTAPIADFSADKTSINVVEYVQFTNLSANNPTSCKWEFTGQKYPSPAKLTQK